MVSELISAKEVAEILKISVNSVYRLSREGKIPCFKIGRRYRYSLDVIESWIVEHLNERR